MDSRKDPNYFITDKTIPDPYPHMVRNIMLSMLAITGLVCLVFWILA